MGTRDPAWILRIWREAVAALYERPPTRRGQSVISNASLKNARARITALEEEGRS